MNYFRSILVLSVVVAGGGGRASQVACPFEVDLCGWSNVLRDSLFYLDTGILPVKTPPEVECWEFVKAANAVKGGGGSAHEQRDQVRHYWKEICARRCYFVLQRVLGKAELISPVMQLAAATVALRVNFSYWLENGNQSASLQLLAIATSGGVFDGIPISLWTTDPKQPSSSEWNSTSVVIHNLHARTLQLAFLGTILKPGGLVAIDTIDDEEISLEDLDPAETSRGTTVTFHLEPEGNPYFCPKNSASPHPVWSPVVLLVIIGASLGYIT